MQVYIVSNATLRRASLGLIAPLVTRRTDLQIASRGSCHGFGVARLPLARAPSKHHLPCKYLHQTSSCTSIQTSSCTSTQTSSCTSTQTSTCTSTQTSIQTSTSPNVPAVTGQGLLQRWRSSRRGGNRWQHRRAERGRGGNEGPRPPRRCWGGVAPSMRRG